MLKKKAQPQLVTGDKLMGFVLHYRWSVIFINLPTAHGSKFNRHNHINHIIICHHTSTPVQ